MIYLYLLHFMTPKFLNLRFFEFVNMLQMVLVVPSEPFLQML